MTCPAGGCWLCQPAAARRTYGLFRPDTCLFPRIQRFFPARLPPAPSWLLYVNLQPLFPPCTAPQKFRLDKLRIFGIIVHAVCQQNRICSGIEEVITSTTGNRVVVKSGTRVRIPPTAPTEKPRKHTVSSVFLLRRQAPCLRRRSCHILPENFLFSRKNSPSSLDSRLRPYYKTYRHRGMSAYASDPHKALQHREPYRGAGAVCPIRHSLRLRPSGPPRDGVLHPAVHRLRKGRPPAAAGL